MNIGIHFQSTAEVPFYDKSPAAIVLHKGLKHFFLHLLIFLNAVACLTKPHYLHPSGTVIVPISACTNAMSGDAFPHPASRETRITTASRPPILFFLLFFISVSISPLL